MHGDIDYTPDAPKKAGIPSAAPSRTTVVKKRKRNKCWCCLWFWMILLVAWPLSLFVSLFYIILMPFGVCVPAIHELCDILLKLMQCPLNFSENLIRCAPVDCADPMDDDEDDDRI